MLAALFVAFWGKFNNGGFNETSHLFNFVPLSNIRVI